MTKLDACKLCSSEKIFIIKKYEATPDLDANWQQAFRSALKGNEKIDIRLGLCLSCGFLFYLDVLDEQELQKLYAEEHRYEKEAIATAKLGRQWELKQMSLFLKKNIQDKQIATALDIGAGDFVALRAIVALLPKTSFTAIDPSFDKPSFENIPVIQSMLNDVPVTKTYDLVMAVHVLEHVGNLQEFLEKMHALTTKYIYIEIPFQVGPGLFLNRSANAQHINYFTPDTILRLVEDNGFVVEDFSFSTDAFRYNGMPGMIRLFASKEIKKKPLRRASLLISIFYLINPWFFIMSKLKP